MIYWTFILLLCLNFIYGGSCDFDEDDASLAWTHELDSNYQDDIFNSGYTDKQDNIGTWSLMEKYSQSFTTYPELIERVHTKIGTILEKKDLTALTFIHKPNILHMKCIKGCELETINTIICTSLGFDGKDHYWKCNSDDIESLNHYLSNYNITCNDQYIGVESCIITYEIQEKIENSGINLIAWYIWLAYVIYALFYEKTSTKCIVLFITCVFITRFVIRVALVLNVWFG